MKDIVTNAIDRNCVVTNAIDRNCVVTNAIDRNCVVTENSKKIDYSKQQRYIDDIRLYNSGYKSRDYIINYVEKVEDE